MKHTLLTDLSAKQHGLVASWQLRSFLTRAQIRYELSKSGRWVYQAPMVYRLRGSAESSLTRPMAGVLAAGPGAHVAFGTAALLWGWSGFVGTPIHVQRPKGSNSRSSADWLRIHESRRLPPEDLTILNGIPLPTPSRLLIDLSFKHPRPRIERWLDWAWSRRQLNHATVLASCKRIGSRGVRGVVWLEEMLAERGEHFVAPASGLESRVNSILGDSGLGQVRRQVQAGGTEDIGRVDFLHPAGVVLEVQSEIHHSALSYQRDDALRIRRLEKAGFAVIEAWEGEIWSTSRSWVRRFADAIYARRAA